MNMKAGVGRTQRLAGYVVQQFTDNGIPFEHITGNSAAEAIENVSRRASEFDAVVAVGGSGRGEMCPYSDVDLLFLHSPAIAPIYEPLASQVQRDFWDCGLKIGASVRTLSDSMQWARQEPQFATSLIDARWLWGSTPLVEQLRSRFLRTVVRTRRTQFIADAIASRDKERIDYGATNQQLEPDLICCT